MSGGKRGGRLDCGAKLSVSRSNAAKLPETTTSEVPDSLRLHQASPPVSMDSSYLHCLLLFMRGLDS
jgi:hypothetical protein